ncbi:MAG: Rrf2 family transcriptional regulator [Syntrophobacterales bacterium]|nr:MAG: Rrf2 family transcriptional regulator [Syntrophobacterales bacterium]
MKLSTRVRYGVRLMISLAEKFGTGSVFLKDIAAEQEISEKYLSLIVFPLRSAGLVLSSRGAHGGYSLAREPKDISLKEIVDTLEGESCLVHCVKEPSSCKRTVICPIRDIWLTVGEKISETLDETTLDQLAASSRQKKETIAEGT